MEIVYVGKNFSLDRIDSSKPHSSDNLRVKCINCNVSKKDADNEIYMWDVETFKEGTDKEHIMYNCGLVKYDTNLLSKKQYSKLKESSFVFYGLDSLSKFVIWLTNNINRLKKKVTLIYDDWVKWFEENGEWEDDEEFEKKCKRKKNHLIKLNRLIIYGFNSGNYDDHFIFKCPDLLFSSIIENHGIISLALEDGYIEFRDVIKMTGICKLEKLCKDFQTSS